MTFLRKSSKMSRFGQDSTPSRESRFKIPKKSPSSVSKRLSKTVQFSPRNRQLPNPHTPLKKSPRRSLPKTPQMASKMLESCKKSASKRIGGAIINSPKPKIKSNRQVIKFNSMIDLFQIEMALIPLPRSFI